MEYPEKKTSECPHCGVETHLTRHGDGALFRGKPGYYYTTDHRCPKLAGVARLNEQMQRAIFGKKP